MAKQQTYQKFIFKIHSTRILNADKNFTISLSEARKYEEVISLADSTVLRWIDELNGLNQLEVEKQIKNKRIELKAIKKLPNSVNNKIKIREIYQELDSLQFKKDYVSVIMDNKSDFEELNQGFTINGVSYQRLVGTPNGVKKSTIVYINSKLHKIISDRLNNGRNEKMKLVPAKFEAYKSLSCSASVPVRNPNGILVVDDLIMNFTANIISLNDEEDKEPVMEEKEEEVELNCSDGFGLGCPELMLRWSEDLKEKHSISGCCIRNSFCKGMIFNFDFHEFVSEFVKDNNSIVVDVWGTPRDINTIELILTTSMLKLWDSYKNLEDYLKNNNDNKYTFSVTKACPEELENERNLNYQFLQSYDLTDEQIQELIKPTVNEIKDVLGGDINKTILFLKGMLMSENDIDSLDCDYIKAIMINPKMINDPYVINKIHYMIKKRINQAKIGVLKVTANYAVVSGDPFALCQHIFKIDIDKKDIGLLKAGEIYSKYWADKNVNQVAVFRAPMTCHNNIRVMNISNNDMVKKWFKHMKTINIINCHDTLAHAANGMDEDGDQLFSTNSQLLIDNTRDLPAIICAQRKAKKKKITENLLIKANKNSFGDDIGRITNYITSMFDVQAGFSKDSKEYQELDYRIKCGQLFQQNAIDKTKGIVAKPMPREWYDRRAFEYIKNPITNQYSVAEKDKFSLSLIADKKPYFMNYIYSSQKHDYEQYIKNTNNKSLMMFRMNIFQLIDFVKSGDKGVSESQQKFVDWYYKKIPVSMNDCTMNKICRQVENEFKGYVIGLKRDNKFDYSILKSNVEYSSKNREQIKQLYKEYLKIQKKYYQNLLKEKNDKDDSIVKIQQMQDEFKRECLSVCSNEKELCEILIDICYLSNKSKQLVWDICGGIIIENLLEKNHHQINYLYQDKNGDIEYNGLKFSKKNTKIGECENVDNSK